MSSLIGQPTSASVEAQSGLVSRNVTIGTHRTSVRLEPDMWNALRDICRREHVTVHDVATIVAVRKPASSSLTAALRVFIMAYYRMAATEDGHNKAGHGPGGDFMRTLAEKRVEEQDDLVDDGESDTILLRSRNN